MTIFEDLKFHVSGTPSKEALSMLSVGGAKKCSYFHTLVRLNIVFGDPKMEQRMEMEEAEEVNTYSISVIQSHAAHII